MSNMVNYRAFRGGSPLNRPAFKRRCVVLAAAAVVAWGSCHRTQAAEGDCTIQLVNKLGVETTVAVERVVHGDDVLNCAAGRWYEKPKMLVVALGDGVFMALPLHRVRGVVFAKGAHTVMLSNGERISGKLISTIKTKDGKEYDLSAATKLTVLDVAADDKPNTPQPRGDGARATPTKWELSVTKPLEKKYEITSPRFAFQYYSSSGYIMGGR